MCKSNVEKLLQLRHGVVGTLDRVSDGARVVVDLPIVAALESLVAKEVDVLVLDAGEALCGVGFGLDLGQAVSLVPAVREDVERDLSADRIAWGGTVSRGNVGARRCNSRQTNVGELLLDGLNHLGSALVGLVPRFKLVSFGLAGVTADRADVDHTVAEFDEGAAHGGQAFEVGDVFQAELGQLLVLFFTDPLEERVGW